MAKDEILSMTVPIPVKYRDAMDYAAGLGNRTRAGWARSLLIRELQRMGLVDDQLNIVKKVP